MATYTVTFQAEGRHPSTVERQVRKRLKLTRADHVTVEKRQHGLSRAERLSEVEQQVQEAIGEVQSLKEELEQWLESLPENLQSGGKADDLQQAIDALEQIEQDMDSVSFDGVEFPGMY